ncbi:efflux transporter outer membrane subunit [Granulibacter bethesdensis]|uniref:efflux transporter outer membrane subunit n=1 Tax=Granulibacter bethesdensis TaxID=364410 RepID=UPI00090BCEF9|nr:efflux transporter outer membrane subunit [Granulibacter bethesdensis]APH58521.1 Type I secretion outer membrane protein [Granulibacter bethesdensis]
MMPSLQTLQKGLRSLLKASSAFICSGIVAGCNLAPDYKVPNFIVPASWHGQGPFREATPADTQIPQKWWVLFQDPTLNDLEERAVVNNADLQAAAERFLQARSMIMKVRSELLPHVGIQAGASNNRQSADSLFYAPGSALNQSDTFYGAVASWEPDFWSRIRNRIRATEDFVQQRAADYAGARLSMEAELASEYIMLRGLDAQEEILNQAITYYNKAIEVTGAQVSNQAAPPLDLIRAKNRLYVTQAQELDIRAERQVVEHAIAILTNASPSTFHIPAKDHFDFPNVNVPVSVPSVLLQRRPDIASSERKMAEANRMIGVARAAFYPDVSLAANGGFDASGFNLGTLQNSLWSYGAAVNIPIFEGGLRRAELQNSWSVYRETRDDYRSKVLSAFKEVEDGLSKTTLYKQEVVKLEEAVKTASQMQAITMTLYTGGLSNYLDAIIAQEAKLDALMSKVQVHVKYEKSVVELIRSVGGGWSTSQIPPKDQLQSFDVFQYDGLRHPKDIGGIPVEANPEKFENLTAPYMPSANTH